MSTVAVGELGGLGIEAVVTRYATGPPDAALRVEELPLALVGFGCLGIGLASVVPAVFSAAGRIPGLHPGTAVATASASDGPGSSAARR